MMRLLKAFLFFLIFFSILTSNAFSVSYANAVKAAAPSVVSIYVVYSPSMGREDPQNYRGGSGVIMDKEGHIITNSHVTSKAEEILVLLSDGKKVQAKLIGSDPEVDISVLKISEKNIEPIILGDTQNLQVGDVVLAIGNPFGLGETVTHGIISAMGRNTAGVNQLENYIQIDAALNPGNSGGALVNAEGKLVGITVGIYSRSGGFQGVGFAIPADVALSIMNQIIKNGRVERGYVGVNVVDTDTKGVQVTQVLSNSPGAVAGIKLKDIILSVNEFPVENFRSFQNYVAQREPGTELRLKILRDGKSLEITLKAGVRPSHPILDDRGRPQLPGEDKDLPDHVS